MNEDIIERLEKIGSETLALAAELKRQNLPPKKNVRTQKKRSASSCHQEPGSDEEDCALAIEVIRQTKRASTSHFQRQLGWGYNHAAAIIDLLQQRGIVAPPVGAGSREICWDKMPKELKG